MTDLNLPANLPASANLPATYTAAKQALAECSRVDECKDWADKAAALACYARQAADHSLLNYAQRIQLRAVNRQGELLKQFPRGDEATRYGQVGTVPPVTRTQAAADAGLSERQRKNALRVANVPRDEFDAAVESDFPPTVAELAARGTQSRPPAPAQTISPPDSAQVAAATSLLREFAAFCGTHDPVTIACTDSIDAELVRGYVSTIDRWLDRFVTNLSGNRAA